MRVPLTRLLNGSKAVMLNIAGCFFPRYSYEPLQREFLANTPLGTERRAEKIIKNAKNTDNLMCYLNTPEQVQLVLFFILKALFVYLW